MKLKPDTQDAVNADAGFRRSRPGQSGAVCIFTCHAAVTLGSSSPFPLRSELISTCCARALRPAFLIAGTCPARDASSRPRQRGSWRFSSSGSGECKGKSIKAYLGGGRMEKTPYFKMCCLHLAKTSQGLKKWMPREKWDDLVGFVCGLHRGWKGLMPARGHYHFSPGLPALTAF